MRIVINSKGIPFIKCCRIKNLIIKIYKKMGPNLYRNFYVSMQSVLLIGMSLALYACGNDDLNKDIEEPSLINVVTFKKAKVAFAEGASQSVEGTFSFPTNTERIKSIKMYIQDICPNKECDEWDRYANIYVKDKTSGEWYEMGRFITPYWVGSEKLERGYEFDVTDFKSLLNGNTELKIYTETWLAKGRIYSVDFDIEYGDTDYKYSAVIPVFQYNKSSIDGVPYGKTHNFDMSRQIQIPSDTELAYFRTIISGWGHATPYDTGNRGCAEWCFRTHSIHINSTSTFEHKLEGIGCADNPINNQAPGNWRPDRAGWCPGMPVPVRLNNIQKSLFGSNFNFEYKFEDWTNNGNGGEAYYAISTFVVVKSNQPIDKATVIN